VTPVSLTRQPSRHGRTHRATSVSFATTNGSGDQQIRLDRCTAVAKGSRDPVCAVRRHPDADGLHHITRHT
jgi:hypothetical protein